MGKTCAETWNFSLPKKIRFQKNQTFAIGPVVFAPRTQTYATELKEWTVVWMDFFFTNRVCLNPVPRYNTRGWPQYGPHGSKIKKYSIKSYVAVEQGLQSKSMNCAPILLVFVEFSGMSSKLRLCVAGEKSLLVNVPKPCAVVQGYGIKIITCGGKRATLPVAKNSLMWLRKINVLKFPFHISG
jgi:hypothetical protein